MQQYQLKAKTIIGYTLAGIVFFLPIKAQVATLFIVISLVLAFVTADWKTYWSRLKANKYFVLSILYFVLHLIGLLYSVNLKYGFKDIESKLSFLIFPLLFTAYTPTENQINFIKKSFIAGCLLALLICLGNAFRQYSIHQQADVFFYSTFSLMLHSTYFSFYLNVALIILIADLYSRFNTDFKSSKLVIYFAIEMILITGILLLSARMSLIVTILTTIVFVTMKRLQQKDGKALSNALYLSFLLAACIQFGLSKIYNRFTQIETAIQNESQIISKIQNNSANEEDYNSTTSRLALWKYSSELVTSTPQNFLFGTGTGDIKDELKKVYIINNFQKGIDENYNPHNQFLHTSVVIGVSGLLLLLLLLFIPLLEAIRKNYLPLAMFIAIILLNALTESILEVQSGIIFFCVFYCLLITEMNLNKLS